MSILTQLLSGKDNATQDIGRWSWAASIVGLHAFAAANWWHTGSLDLVAYGTSVATVVGAHSAAIWAKKSTEPGQ